MAKVLLIEDDADTRLLFRLVLEGARHAVIDAASGAEGLRAARDRRIDCVLIDVGLPDLDGWKVVEEIRAIDPHRDIAIIVLTGHADDGARTRSRAAGADEHLVKPVAPTAIVATVARLVTERRERGR